MCVCVCVCVCACACVPRRSGLTSEGIYRKSGVNSRVAALCEAFRRDARSICLREGVHQVDDVSNTLKRFFRDVEAGLFTTEASAAWLSVVGKAPRFTPPQGPAAQGAGAHSFRLLFFCRM